MIFKNLYQYRELLKTNVKKEIRGKYKGSFLGVLWSFLNPLLMVLVYALVFSVILKQDIPNYVIFLIVGVIPWNFFTTVIMQGTNCIWINGGIIKKVYFPREILPVSVVLAGLENFLISCVIIFIFVLFSGMGFSIHLVWLPLIAILQTLFSLGLLFILSAVDVYVRDVEYLMNFLISLLFYATPIVYTVDLFPESVRWILYLNPMTHFIVAYRSIFYYQTAPSLMSILYISLFAVFFLVFGYMIFRKLEKGFAEEV